LRRAFLDIAAAEPWRCVVIDAARSEDDVAAAIWSAVQSRLDPAGAVKAKRA
jgi:dTMP kinase